MIIIIITTTTTTTMLYVGLSNKLDLKACLRFQTAEFHHIPEVRGFFLHPSYIRSDMETEQEAEMRAAEPGRFHQQLVHFTPALTPAHVACPLCPRPVLCPSELCTEDTEHRIPALEPLSLQNRPVRRRPAALEFELFPPRGDFRPESEASASRTPFGVRRKTSSIERRQSRRRCDAPARTSCLGNNTKLENQRSRNQENTNENISLDSKNSSSSLPQTGGEPLLGCGHLQWLGLDVGEKRRDLIGCKQDAAVADWLQSRREVPDFLGTKGSLSLTSEPTKEDYKTFSWTQVSAASFMQLQMWWMFQREKDVFRKLQSSCHDVE
nr:uncharacterized protein LOC129166979 [Nothobranchius furzeri]